MAVVEIPKNLVVVPEAEDVRDGVLDYDVDQTGKVSFITPETAVNSECCKFALYVM